MDKVYMLTVETLEFNRTTRSEVTLYASKDSADNAFDDKVKEAVSSLRFSMSGVEMNVDEPQPEGKTRRAVFDDTRTSIEIMLEEKQVFS